MGLWCSGWAWAAAPPQATEFRIPAGGLDRALLDWAAQSGMQLIYSPTQVSGLRSAGLSRRLPPVQALAELLKGTQVTAIQIVPGVYTLRQAPLGTRSPGPVGPARPVPSQPPSTPAQLQPVQVTGSRIPQFTLVAPTPTSVISREQIESSGYFSLFDLLRTQPGMNGYAPVSVAFEDGNSPIVPNGAPAATGLYGLSPRATLFLVDGRRVASYALVSSNYGALTDLESIPLSMVDHVEILRGGASAIYGADAMAGVVNIVLRKDMEGGEASMRYGLSERGDAAQRRFSISQGWRLGDAHLLVSADRLERDGLAGDARVWHSDDLRRFGLADRRYPQGVSSNGAFLFQDIAFWPNCPRRAKDPDGSCWNDQSRYRDLSPALDSTSVRLYLEQPIGARATAYADVRTSHLRQRIASTPTRWVSYLANGNGYGFTAFDVGQIHNEASNDQLDLALGLEGHGTRWDWNLGYTRSRNETRSRVSGSVSYNSLVDATRQGRYVLGDWDAPEEVVREISPIIVNRGRQTEDGVAADVTGSAFDLAGGAVGFAVGAAVRREALRIEPDALVQDGSIALSIPTAARSAQRWTQSVYAELSLPVLRSLTTDLALRMDRASRSGSRLSPSAGFKWQASDALILRGSYAGGYRAPTLYEQRAPSESALRGVRAPRYFEGRCSTQDCVIYAQLGENVRLHPETSTSRTLGAIMTPLPGLELSLDHFRIVRRDEIRTNQPLKWPQDNLQDYFFDDSGGVQGFYQYYDNLGRSQVAGWEASLNYFRKTAAWGVFDLRLSATWLQRADYVYLRGDHTVETLDHELPRTTMTGSLGWKSGSWSHRLNLYAASGLHAYPAGESCPAVQLEQHRCGDPARYVLGMDIGWSGIPGWLLALNVGNLTDRQPRSYRPLAGGYNASLDDVFGRYYRISATWRF